MLWFILVTGLSLLIIYKYLYKPLLYWKENNVIYSKDALPLFGNTWRAAFGKVTFIENFLDIYNEFPHESFNGFYMFLQPSLQIRDLDLIKQITVKDFDHFTDHKHQPNTADVNPLFSKNLLQLNGDEWKQMRATLSPAFTGSKMKAMFSLISECAKQVISHYSNFKDEVIEVDMRDFVTRYANDVIATCAFGVQCDSIRNRENEFYSMGNEATNFTTYRLMKFSLYSIFPKLFKYLEYRTKHDVVRPDMIHLLMEARKGKLKHEETQDCQEDFGFSAVEESAIGKSEVVQRHISDEEIAAQAFVFFVAGFETSSVILSFMALELAINADIQDKLKIEIDQVMESCNENITYEAVRKMKYLDMVVSETLRKWPPGPITDRQCTKDITIKKHGKEYTLKKRENIAIPIIGIHRDEKYYKDPERFDPERFSEENIGNIVPYAYIPFGVGPRACLGSRFALLEIKTMFSYFLSKFDLVVTEKTSAPIVIAKKSFKMQPEGGFWVGIKARKS